MAEQIRGGIVISEILADPNGINNFDTDGDGTARGGDEFIELRNDSDGAIDIGGLEFWDRGRGGWYTVPDGTILQPDATFTVVRDVAAGGSLPSGGPNDVVAESGFGQNVINNNGDNVVIYDPDADEYIQALFNGDAEDDPVGGPGYAGFSATATQIGVTDDFGSDVDGQSMQLGPGGNEYFTGTPTPAAENICFCSGARILTPTGPRLIETLGVGDLVITRDRGMCAIRWVGRRDITWRDQLAQPSLRPILIRAGALGPDAPQFDLRLSPQHRVVCRLPGGASLHSHGLIAVVSLLGRPGVEIDESGASFSYHHIALDRHEVIFAEGLPTETLLFGKQARETLGADQMAELERIFPDLDITGEQPADELVPTAYGPIVH
ncbi:Hint domain-containing protein [Pontivivens insulae]|uniref:LTD domain-containing protein n=1 Tax=Pontivivens insulae TaxID=1639689 RepID=A0A2R8AB42_9RHOB|nr:Hint domain-containing protein [Pontivivens insulae]RED11380.1 lamin tail-like protein [Pontivivens insulae]SPF29447.1 hypothetical protein POI8812_01757 [Pontivivens insulae]